MDVLQKFDAAEAQAAKARKKRRKVLEKLLSDQKGVVDARKNRVYRGGGVSLKVYLSQYSFLGGDALPSGRSGTAAAVSSPSVCHICFLPSLLASKVLLSSACELRSRKNKPLISTLFSWSGCTRLWHAHRVQPLYTLSGPETKLTSSLAVRGCWVSAV